MAVSAAGNPSEPVIAGDANPAYAAFHRPRFQFLIETLRPCASPGASRFLDIGASPLTSRLATELEVSVDSLGLEPDHQANQVRHYQFDLNEAQRRERWRTDLGPYDVIVFAEVIEHLYTAPELVLAYLRELLRPKGVLVVQTPNAVALRKRAKMLLGMNPFERIRADRSNPGHFREYTRSELVGILQQAGFTIDQVWMRYYFDARYAHHDIGNEPARPLGGALRNTLYRLLPSSLREGITIVAHKA